jgi:hypothetical protein
MPSGKVARLKYSINNLWDEWGNVDSIGLGIVINLGLAAIGVLGYVWLSGILAYVAAVWAILNVLPVLQWVLRL